jgi:hypothetical protein
MNIETYRNEWNIDRDTFDLYVDNVTKELLKNNAPTVAVMSVDTVFRAFIYWIGAAHRKRIEADLTRDTLVNLVSIMIIDVATRMNSPNSIDLRMEMTNWTRDLISDIAAHLMNDIKEVVENTQRRPMQ